MRRLTAASLLLALLAPLLAGNPAAVVCAMHTSASWGVAHAMHSHHRTHHTETEHQRDSHDRANTHGCNCPGECGSSRFSFNTSRVSHDLPIGVTRHAMQIVATTRPLGVDKNSLHLATGPPPSLRS